MIHSQTMFYRVVLPTRGNIEAWLYYDYAEQAFLPVPIPIGNDGPEVKVRPETAFRHEELELVEKCPAWEFVAAAAGWIEDGPEVDADG